MATDEFIKWLTPLGIGGILAAFIFAFYRKDIRLYTELWKQQSELLMKVIIENTASNVKLISVIDALHRRLDAEIRQPRQDIDK